MGLEDAVGGVPAEGAEGMCNGFNRKLAEGAEGSGEDEDVEKATESQSHPPHPTPTNTHESHFHGVGVALSLRRGRICKNKKQNKNNGAGPPSKDAAELEEEPCVPVNGPSSPAFQPSSASTGSDGGDDGEEVYVSGVVEGGGVARCGRVALGDVLLSVDGRRVTG